MGQIRLSANGGEIASDLTAVISHPIGLGISLSSYSPKLHRGGYELTGWNTQRNGRGQSFGIREIVTTQPGTLTLYAQWKEAFRVVYHGNGATSGLPPVDEKKYAAGSLAVVLNPTMLTKDGEEFVGWSTNRTDNSAVILPGSALRINTVMTRLYAQWRRFTVGMGENLQSEEETP